MNNPVRNTRRRIPPIVVSTSVRGTDANGAVFNPTPSSAGTLFHAARDYGTRRLGAALRRECDRRPVSASMMVGALYFRW